MCKGLQQWINPVKIRLVLLFFTSLLLLILLFIIVHKVKNKRAVTKKSLSLPLELKESCYCCCYYCSNTEHYLSWPSCMLHNVLHFIEHCIVACCAGATFCGCVSCEWHSRVRSTWRRSPALMSSYDVYTPSFTVMTPWLVL